MGIRMILEKDKLILNNNTSFVGDILMDFIYQDFSTITKQIQQCTYKFFENSQDLLIPEDLKDELDKILSDTSFVESILKFEIISCVKENSSKYIYPTITNINEITNIDFNNLNYEINYSFLNKVDMICKSLFHLQDHFYEAINICLNTSHKKLDVFSLVERINYYSSFEVNILKNFSQYVSYNEIFIVDSNSDLSNSNNYEDTIQLNTPEKSFCLPTNTDVNSRLNKPTFDENKTNVINNSKNYSLIYNYTPKHSKDLKLVKVIDFNNLIGLLFYCFNILLEYNSKYEVKECKLCKKLFITTNNQKSYCDNIFGNTKKPCSKIGRSFIHKSSNQDEIYKYYMKVYKRLNNRNYKKDKKAFEDYTNLYKQYKNNKINESHFKKIIRFFDDLKENNYNEENLNKLLKELNI